LCIFDADRTLTGKQGDEARCPSDVQVPHVYDKAYGGGTLMISELLNNFATSFCGKCAIGIISQGTASGDGSKERAVLASKLNVNGGLPTSVWNPYGCTVVNSPLVTGCHDGQKQTAVPQIQQWYREKHAIDVPSEHVYFFDDKKVNIQSLLGSPYNAQQISCEPRDDRGALGFCGARLSEVQERLGIHFCSGTAGAEDLTFVV